MYQSLVLHRPILSKRITQKFGENKACMPLQGGKVISCDGKNPPPGYRSIYGSYGHNGNDLSAFHGEPCYHAGTYDGWMKTEKDSAGGIGVDVISKEPLFFPGKPPKGLKVRTVQNGFLCHVKTRYWHLLNVVGHDGKEVKYGQMIGRCDNTGLSSGTHLHWSVKWCDKDGNTLLPDNGFNGCFDQNPYYDHSLFAGDTSHTWRIDVPPLTEQERKEDVQLSLLTRVLLLMRELIYKL